MAKRYNLFSKVFDRTPNKINSIVNYQKSIMDVSAIPEVNFRILGIMLLYIKINL